MVKSIQQSNVDGAFKSLVHVVPTFLELEHGYAPPTQEIDILINGSGVEEKRRSVDEVRSITGSKSTNPFLSDMNEESEEDGGPLVLNPNNPFLSYIIDKKGTPQSSNNGSESTDYESCVEKVTVEQKWMDENKEVEIEQRWLSSDNDVVSLVESLSIKNATDISQTATSATRRDCATQTSDNATGPPVLYQGPSMPPSLPYGGYPPQHHYGGYPPWSTASDCAPFEYGPRYPAPGYGYPANPPIQPWMMQMPRSSMQFRSQYNPGMGPAYHQQAQYQTQGSCQHQYPPKASLRPPRFYPPRTLPSKPSSVDTSTPTITPCPPPSASDF